ncbi:unnamed protein product, partial [Nesidiocoris tenuis]
CQNGNGQVETAEAGARENLEARRHRQGWRARFGGVRPGAALDTSQTGRPRSPAYAARSPDPAREKGENVTAAACLSSSAFSSSATVGALRQNDDKFCGGGFAGKESKKGYFELLGMELTAQKAGRAIFLKYHQSVVRLLVQWMAGRKGIASRSASRRPRYYNVGRSRAVPWGRTMERYHGAVSWSGTMEPDHGAVPWSGTMELDHVAVPWSGTMERYHGAVPWSRIVERYSAGTGIPWSRTISQYHGAVSWSPTMEPYHGAVLWSRTMERYYGAVLWSGTMEPYRGAEFPIEEKLEPDTAPRFIEQEGLYVGKKTKIPSKRRNKLEQRIMAMGSESALQFTYFTITDRGIQIAANRDRSWKGRACFEFGRILHFGVGRGSCLLQASSAVQPRRCARSSAFCPGCHLGDKDCTRPKACRTPDGFAELSKPQRSDDLDPGATTTEEDEPDKPQRVPKSKLKDKSCEEKELLQKSVEDDLGGSKKDSLLEFCSEEQLLSNPRLKLLMLRAAGQPEFRNMRNIPINEREIPKDIFKNFGPDGHEMATTQKAPSSKEEGKEEVARQRSGRPAARELVAGEKTTPEMVARFVSLIPVIPNYQFFPGQMDIWLNAQVRAPFKCCGSSCTRHLLFFLSHQPFIPQEIMDRCASEIPCRAALLACLLKYYFERTYLLIGTGVPGGPSAFVLTFPAAGAKSNTPTIWDPSTSRKHGPGDPFSPLSSLHAIIDHTNVRPITAISAGCLVEGHCPQLRLLRLIEAADCLLSIYVFRYG